MWLINIVIAIVLIIWLWQSGGIDIVLGILTGVALAINNAVLMFKKQTDKLI